jgi:ankyrin repeat protein
MTPLMHSALMGFPEGANELLDRKAEIDQTNRRGETALILAVQAKNTAMVRLLVRRGASPDKADHIAGMSARDYAKRDDRSGQMLGLLDAKAEGALRDSGPAFGPN